MHFLGYGLVQDHARAFNAGAQPYFRQVGQAAAAMAKVRPG